MKSFMTLSFLIISFFIGHARASVNSISELTQFLKDKNIQSLAEFKRELPSELSENYTMVYDSKSLQTGTLKNPRVILADKNYRLIIAYSDAGLRVNDSKLEVMELPSKDRLKFAEISFPGSNKAAEVKTEPQSCFACHQSGTEVAPIFPTYPNWVGVYGSNDNGFIYGRDSGIGRLPIPEFEVNAIEELKARNLKTGEFSHLKNFNDSSYRSFETSNLHFDNAFTGFVIRRSLELATQNLPLSSFISFMEIMFDKTKNQEFNERHFLEFDSYSQETAQYYQKMFIALKEDILKLGTTADIKQAESFELILRGFGTFEESWQARPAAERKLVRGLISFDFFYGELFAYEKLMRDVYQVPYLSQTISLDRSSHANTRGARDWNYTFLEFTTVPENSLDAFFGQDPFWSGVYDYARQLPKTLYLRDFNDIIDYSPSLYERYTREELGVYPHMIKNLDGFENEVKKYIVQYPPKNDAEISRFLAFKAFSTEFRGWLKTYLPNR